MFGGNREEEEEKKALVLLIRSKTANIMQPSLGNFMSKKLMFCFYKKDLVGPNGQVRD